MPTITQLPTSSTTTAADIVPVSQNGSTCAVSLGTLLAGTQPAIQIDPLSLLGRTSVGAGGPEQVDIGSGLSLTSGTLLANGLDHTLFPVHLSPGQTDKVVLSTDSGPSLLPVVALRSLFRPGANISITSSGIISANDSGTGISNVDITQLDTLPSVTSSDLVTISHSGTTYAASVSALLNGTTIGQTAAARSPSETDMFLVSQGSDILVRQDMGTTASWLTQRIKSSAPDVVVTSSNTTIDLQLHSGKVLVCTTGISLSIPSSITANFQCEVLNVSGSDVTLASTIRTSSGTQILPAGQGMRLYCLQYSGTKIVYAWISVAPTNIGGTSVLGQPTLTSANPTSPTSVQLTWTAPTAAIQLTYTVNYRQSGASTWTSASTNSISTQYNITNLSAGTAYEFSVMASAGNIAGPVSNLITVVLPTMPVVVSSPLSLTTAAIAATTAVLRWNAPNSGQVQSYTVEYRIVGAAAWSIAVVNGSILTTSLAGLLASQTYEWRVTAVDAASNHAVSIINSFTTLSLAQLVTAISWNVVPAGPFPKGAGAIGVNAHVTPATASVQYGTSSSSTIQPSTWVQATYVNNDLWGAYLPTPSSAGNYYVWAQGTDGSATTVSSLAISVI